MPPLVMDSEVATAPRYTLVVGAGINANRNVPGWAPLVNRAWLAVFGKRNDYRRSVSARVEEARSALQEHLRWSSKISRKLDIAVHPFEAQFALELIDLELRENAAVAKRVSRLLAKTPPRVVPPSTRNLLPSLLARCLYERVSPPRGQDTLFEIARFVRRSNRLARVISLNVDNLLELEVQRIASRYKEGRSLQVVSRQRHRPNFSIPSYHIHGFLPVNALVDVPTWAVPRRSRRARLRLKRAQDREHMTEPVPESLVFTDSQYWRSAATPLSFGNFVFANALHDSSCVFIGLSMTDINILRWLGLHAGEFSAEYAREQEYHGRESTHVPRPYLRHCWIRPRSDDPTELISRLLARRGVCTHELRSWKSDQVRASFDELLEFDRP